MICGVQERVQCMCFVRYQLPKNYVCNFFYLLSLCLIRPVHLSNFSYYNVWYAERARKWSERMFRKIPITKKKIVCNFFYLLSLCLIRPVHLSNFGYIIIMYDTWRKRENGVRECFVRYQSPKKIVLVIFFIYSPSVCTIYRGPHKV